MSVSETAGHSAGPGPRTWRAAVVLFLTVFVVGLGLSGASAVWTQSGAVTAQVTTGKWVDYSRSGFSMPLVASTSRADCNPFFCSTRLSWTNDAKLNSGTDKVTYRVEATQIDRMRVIEPGRPNQSSASEMTLTTSRPYGRAESVRITITPYVNGVAGTPTVKELWLDRNGGTWLTDAR
ncbi:hypothetical protein [Brachybacterium sp. UNK5269]|uniref:hypothetical protein n=1 Tax=Brachybacterium sp. UNK5269 TaxID=3408576 RepID=UPI003BB15559